MRHLRRVLVLGLAILAACGSERDGDNSAPACPTANGTTALRYDSGTAAVNLKPVFDGFCTRCHSTTPTEPNRGNAPGDANFNTYAGILQHVDHIPDQVGLRAMPPAGFPAPSDPQRQQIVEWALCGAPQ